MSFEAKGVIVAALISVGLLVLIGYASWRSASDCESRGGVYHCTSGSVVTYGDKGTQVGTSTNCECYTRDGRVLLP